MFSDPDKNVAQFGLQHGMHVVDMGAGSGFYSMAAAKLVGSSGRVYAIEVQRDLLDRLKKDAAALHLSNIEVIWGDIESLGGTRLRDAIADRVIVSNTLAQIEHKDQLFLEIKRILKPAGTVLIIDWTERTPLSPAAVVTRAQAELLAAKVGLTFESTITAGDHHYGIILSKSHD